MTGPALSSQPRTVWNVRSGIVAANVTAAGLYIVADGQSAVLSTLASSANSNRILAVERAEWEVYSKDLGFHWSMRWVTAGVAPGIDVYASVWRVTSLGGVGASPTVVLGAEVAGARTATRTINAANAVSAYDSAGPFELDPTGVYALTVQVSAAMAANSTIALLGRLSCQST